MATIEDYNRALEEALADDRYQWGSPLGVLLYDYISDVDDDDTLALRCAVHLLVQYQKAVDHPDGGFVALSSTHEHGGVTAPGYR